MNPQPNDSEFFKAGAMLSEAAGQIRTAVRIVTMEAAKASYLTKQWHVASERPDGRPSTNDPARVQSMQVLTEHAVKMAALADEVERYCGWFTYEPEESS